jgi:hypothetical protein
VRILNRARETIFLLICALTVCARSVLSPIGHAETNAPSWWSLQPIVRPPVPELKVHSAENPIDQFILAKLEARNISASAMADRRTLIRRVSFDLLGLPPSPKEVQRFLDDADPQAYEHLIDRLLASPQYGERWARHWLDVVHYGDTHGYDKDQPRPNAWPYRDYVIRSFNEDKPYSRFVTEQLAGDISVPNDPDALEALGFISAGPWDLIGHAELPESKTDGKIARHLDRDDMVANTMSTFTSLTVHCAQCHDHKFDPISSEDYYSLQAVFAAVDRTNVEYYRDPALTKKRNELKSRERGLSRDKQELERLIEKLGGAELSGLKRQLAELKKKKDAENNAAAEAELQQQLGTILEEKLDSETKSRWQSTTNALTLVQSNLGAMPKPSIAFVGAVHHGAGAFRGTGPEGGKPRPIHVLARGDVKQPRALVKPGALSALHPLAARFDLPPDHSEAERRRALADWITDPRNPLTWRSIVNRIWQYHFGRGLVETPNDFGHMGSLPSHPELLDWLAIEFRDGGQSIKTLHKVILTSATYRQVSTVDPGNPAAKLDGDNRLLWRMNRRKLEAEALRDCILAVSGKLNPALFGPGFQDFVIEKPEHSPHYQYHLYDPDDPRSHRRSIYRFIVRSQQQPFMTTLDCADPSMLVDKRNESLSALQALALLNNSFMLTMSRHFAERLTKERSNLDSQIANAFWLALGRAPSEAEQGDLAAFAKEHGLANTCRVLFNLNEFAFVD